MKIKWVRFFSSEVELKKEMGARNSLEVKINGKSLILLKHENQYFLIKNKCPHQGLPMKDAKCEGDHVICPYHQYKFSLEHGRGNGLYLERYPIQIRKEGVFAGFEYFSIF